MEHSKIETEKELLESGAAQLRCSENYTMMELESSHFHNFKYTIFSPLGDSLLSKNVAKGQSALRDWSIFKYGRSSLSVGFQEIDPVHFRLNLLCCI